MIKIGQTYLNTIGEPQKIVGHVKISAPGGGSMEDTERVWSLQGNHYHVRTGKNSSPGPDLVDDLDVAPDLAIDRWHAIIAQFQAANDAAHLELIRGNLMMIRRRIAWLIKLEYRQLAANAINKPNARESPQS